VEKKKCSKCNGDFNALDSIYETCEDCDPYDIFISYKESKEGGGSRTEDSELVENLIYEQLKKEGFKVFFSRKSTENKLGKEYEPFIERAIKNAKVMLVVGTKPCYFESEWVRKEWSTFLANCEDNGSRLLIPCYRNMNGGELPDELSKLQGQDMSRDGAMPEIIRKIREHLKEQNEKLRSVLKEAHSNKIPLPWSGYSWHVLCLENDRALLFSDKVVTESCYGVDDGETDLVWENCCLREYLNTAFYQSLDMRLKTLVVKTKLSNKANQWYGVSGGSDTEDTVFLLSIEEVVRYFDDSGQLADRPSNDETSIYDCYNCDRIADNIEGAASAWWLRSPGEYGCAAYVGADGTIAMDGMDTHSKRGVRPALWIKIPS
jgi:hypothetical protein